jgi:hypothetical protein
MRLPTLKKTYAIFTKKCVEMFSSKLCIFCGRLRNFPNLQYCSHDPWGDLPGPVCPMVTEPLARFQTVFIFMFCSTIYFSQTCFTTTWFDLILSTKHVKPHIEIEAISSEKLADRSNYCIPNYIACQLLQSKLRTPINTVCGRTKKSWNTAFPCRYFKINFVVLQYLSVPLLYNLRVIKGPIF